MKSRLISVLSIPVLLISLSECTMHEAGSNLRLSGTWQLISGMTITKNDTVMYPTGSQFIKIINDSHFAFLKHDVNLPKDSSNHFDAGGGRYTLSGDQYTEHLDFYADRNWEGKTFTFTIKLSNDTLTQTGIEKVEGANVDHTIVEKYVRVRYIR